MLKDSQDSFKKFSWIITSNKKYGPNQINYR